MDIFLPILGLLMIMALVVGATIKINTLLIGKSLTNILLIIASILAMFMIIILVIHYFMGTLAWDIFFVSLVIITIPFLTADVIADRAPKLSICLLYTSDAADEEESVDLGGRRIIKKKKKYKP